MAGDRTRIDNAVSLQPRLEQKEAAVEALLSFTERGVDPFKEEFLQLFGVLIKDIGYRYNGGPFDPLKSEEFEHISNDSLRRDIIREYTNCFPDTRARLEKFNQQYGEDSKPF